MLSAETVFGINFYYHPQFFHNTISIIYFKFLGKFDYIIEIVFKKLYILYFSITIILNDYIANFLYLFFPFSVKFFEILFFDVMHLVL